MWKRSRKPKYRLAGPVLAALVLAVLAACGGGSSGSGAPVGTDGSATAGTTTLTEAQRQADVGVLMMGNSHTVGAGLPEKLAALLRAALPGRSVAVVVAPGSAFLDEHLSDSTTQALMTARRWSAVVLQAQKYSSSGLFDYSTAAAEEWVRRSRAQGAVPVLFPEWARAGIAETPRIWALHSGIASRVPACVAPIPQAWDRALGGDAASRLHSSDGNHAAAAGAQLTALVLAATITGFAPTQLAETAVGGDAALQHSLRTSAAEAVAQQDPRAYCPGDPLVR
jgi:hypothetical protein